MNFDKVISNMQELQSKIEIYEQKNKKIEDTLSSIKKEILKIYLNNALVYFCYIWLMFFICLKQL